jgi:hypothetical protein
MIKYAIIVLPLFACTPTEEPKDYHVPGYTEMCEREPESILCKEE